MVGFAICSYLKTQGPLVASLGLSLLLRSLTTERRRSSLKSLLPDGKNLGFSRQTPVFPGFAGVLETRQNPGKQGVNHYKNTLTPLRFSVLPDSPFIKTGNSNRARKGNREHEKNFNRPPQVPLSSRRNTQETRRCNPAETGRVIGKTRVNPAVGTYSAGSTKKWGKIDPLKLRVPTPISGVPNAAPYRRQSALLRFPIVGAVPEIPRGQVGRRMRVEKNN